MTSLDTTVILPTTTGETETTAMSTHTTYRTTWTIDVGPIWGAHTWPCVENTTVTGHVNSVDRVYAIREAAMQADTWASAHNLDEVTAPNLTITLSTTETTKEV